MEQKYSNFSNFIACYFHGDDDSKTIKDILENFFKGNGSDLKHLKSVVKEVNELIAENLPEKVLQVVMIDMGMHISIDNDDWKPTSHTYKEWIVDLRDILQKELDKRLQEKK